MRGMFGAIYTVEERTVVLDEEAFTRVWLLAGLTKESPDYVASQLCVVGYDESMRRARLINELRGDDT